MITVYIYRKHEAEKNLIRWLNKRGYIYKEIDILRHPPSREQIIHFISLTENSLFELLSTRGRTYKSLDIDYESITLEDFILYIQKNPKLLKTPLIADEHHLQIGFNEDAIRQFIPRNHRKISRVILKN